MGIRLFINDAKTARVSCFRQSVKLLVNLNYAQDNMLKLTALRLI